MSSSLRMEAEVLNLRTRHPFIISRGGQSDYRTIWVRLVDHDGVEGWGEAAPARIYGESTETVLASLQDYRRAPGGEPRVPPRGHRAPVGDADAAQPGRALRPLRRAARPHGQEARRPGVPVVGPQPGQGARSTFTIGIDTAEKLRQKVLEAEEYPILKIKLGTDRDVEILKTIRDLTAKELRVDANTGWNTKQAIRMLPVLEEFGVTVLEQPLPADDLDGLAEVTRHSRIPVIADESCLVAADIPRLVGKVDGINIKLAKCGSLREALRMIAIARAHHLMVMVGCVIESSIAITAAAHFTPLVDIVDLDGAALLANDPFQGATITGGQVRLPTGPGLGLSRR